jgi:hypothetical protein
MVLEALGHHDLNTVRRAGHRITNRLVFGLEYSRDRYLGAAARQIEIEPDRRKDRVEHLCNDQTENVEYRAFGRILPGQYTEQCLALRRRRPFVDDRLKGSVALMQRSRKIDGDAEIKTVEPHVTEMPIGDVHADQSLAVAICRPGVEVTGTAESTVAVLDPVALKTPFSSGHIVFLPFKTGSSHRDVFNR